MKLLCFCFMLLTAVIMGLMPRQQGRICPPGSDSLLSKLQSTVERYQDKIDKHYSMLFYRDDTDAQLTELRKKHKIIEDSLKAANSFNVKNLCARVASEGEDKVREELKASVTRVSKLEAEKSSNDSEMAQAAHSIFMMDSILRLSRKDSAEIGTRLAELTRDLDGAGILKMSGVSYRFFIATRKDHDVHIYTSTTGPSTVEGIRQRLLNKKKDPLMITNGGMFTPEYKPQGLLIEDFKKYADLDTTRPEAKAKLNFYLVPNGVFLIDSGGSFEVIETHAYEQAYGKKRVPRFATQSGPLLVDEGVINKNFRANSSNVNIRSGIGVMTADKIVFVISDSPVNLYDFSVLFKEVFRCKNSLYLDGAISQMYINEKMLKGPLAGSGTLGPMISVTKK